MGTITAQDGFVYPPLWQGLIRLLAFALASENSHSRQWVSPLLNHLTKAERCWRIGVSCMDDRTHANVGTEGGGDA